jgi:hypothetical protein
MRALTRGPMPHQIAGVARIEEFEPRDADATRTE